MRMNNRGFGVVEVIIILAVMIVLAMVFVMIFPNSLRT